MRSFLLTLSLFSLLANGYTQTAEDVINRYVEALGGKDKLNNIQSVYMEGVSTSPSGNEITTRIYRVQDKLYRREVNFGMGSVTVIITDKEGWSSSPRSNGEFEVMSAEAISSQQRELDIAGPLVNFASKGHQVNLLGKETVDGKEAYKIKLTMKSGNDITYYIDTKNFHLIRQSFKGGNGMFGGRNRQGGDPNAEVNIDYADYRKTDGGFLFPFETRLGNMGNKLTFQKIEVNKPVDQALYRPK